MNSTGRFLLACITVLLLPVLQSGAFELFLPLHIRDDLLGEVRAEIDPDTAELRRVDAEALSMLRPYLQVPAYNRLSQAVDEQRFITVEDAAARGLQLRFDELDIVVRAVPSAEIEAAREIVLGLRRRPNPDTLTAVAPFAAYLNIRALVEHELTERRDETQQTVPLGLGLEAAAARGQLSGRASTVVQSEPGTRDPVELERALLRYDFPLQRVRAEAGTTELPQAGLVASQTVLGASVRSDPQLDPYTARRTASATDLYLERPSEVEIRVNERRIERLQLPAGSFALRDYPLSAGINKVELEITDDLGRTETLVLSEPFSTQLLPPGEFAYHAGAGLNWRDRETAAGSASLRYGVTRRVSLGTGLQTTIEENLVALDATFALPLGNLRADAALHMGEDDGSFATNSALNMEYSFGVPWRRELPRASLGLRIQEADYRPPSPSEWQGPADLARLRVNLSQTLLGRLGVSATYQRSWARSPNLDSNAISTVASIAPSRGATLSLRLGYEWDEAGGSSFRGFLGYTHTLGGGAVSTTAGQDLADNSGSVGVRGSYEPRPAQLVTLGGRLSGLPSHSDNDWNGGLSARYVTPYFETSLQHDSEFSSSRSVERHRSGLQLGTALAFAEGVLAPSRPISDAFVIFVRDSSLSDVALELRSEGGTRATPMDRWGRVVVPGLRSYYPYTFFVDAPFLPDGYDLGPGSYVVEPGYQQGAVIAVGSDARVYAEGRLIDASGAPVALSAGRVYTGSYSALQDTAPEERPPGELFFSDRDGILVLYGLRPGVYHLRLSGLRYAEFSIPDGTIGRYELGELQVQGGTVRESEE